MHSDRRLHEAIRSWLDAEGVAYRAIRHAATHTSEESAQARGEELRFGGKAMLLRVGDDAFRLFVLSAALRLDSAAIKARFGVKKLRFATAEELLGLTGLVPGSVPPFGPPILPFELFVDESIAANERIAFNAASLTDSLVMSSRDYLRVARPQVFSFAIANDRA